MGKGDKRSSWYRTTKSLSEDRGGFYGRVLSEDKVSNQQSCHYMAQESRHRYVDPNILKERLELLVLETKAGNDGLNDGMLNLFKKLLSMHITNQEQLDNFVLNYGK